MVPRAAPEYNCTGESAGIGDLAVALAICYQTKRSLPQANVKTDLREDLFYIPYSLVIMVLEKAKV